MVQLDAIQKRLIEEIAHIDDEATIKQVRAEITELCRAKPLYPGLY